MRREIILLIFFTISVTKFNSIVYVKSKKNKKPEKVGVTYTEGVHCHSIIVITSNHANRFGTEGLVLAGTRPSQKTLKVLPKWSQRNHFLVFSSPAKRRHYHFGSLKQYPVQLIIISKYHHLAVPNQSRKSSTRKIKSKPTSQS